jgi:AcrR family transcriptional regulator
VSAPETPRLGLRERKKIKLRRTVQNEALRLFETQGYEHTTVEQIAEAAEVSAATFYRYFPTKEDVVLDDDYDPIVTTAFATRPPDETVMDTIRAVTAAIAKAVEADRDYNLTRLRLTAIVPALQTRYAGEERRSMDLFAQLIADRTGRSSTDYQVALAAAALVAVLFTASRHWAADHTTTPIGSLMDEAVTTIEPVLRSLDQPAHLTRKRSR